MFFRGNWSFGPPSPSISEQQHPQSTVNTHLMHFYPGFIQHFSLSKLLHIDSHSWRSRLWRSVQNQWDQGRERERERGRRAIWIGVWSIFKRFSRVLTWFDQKHPAGTGPCSHKGRPLMLLPSLSCWPNPPPPTSLRLTLCCDIKYVHRNKCSFFNLFVFAGCVSLGTLPTLMSSKILELYTYFAGRLLLSKQCNKYLMDCIWPTFINAALHSPLGITHYQIQ